MSTRPSKGVDLAVEYRTHMSGMTRALYLVGVMLTSLVATLSSSDVLRADEARESIPTLPAQIAMTDLSGATYALGQKSGRKVLAIVFLSTECPIAKGSVPELNRIHSEFRKSGHEIELFGVISDRTVTRATAARFAEEYKIGFQVLFDGSSELAAALHPTHTPEAFVLTGSGKLAYRGRIDDSYAALGKRRPQVATHDLHDAIAMVIAGRDVARPRTEPVGCRFEQQRNANPASAVTYTRDIAPLLQAHCMNCHREGEVAPFPMTSYDDAAKRAGQIADVTRSRFMPPWKPDTGFGHFIGERRLTDYQLALLAKWADAGAPRGDSADLPPAPKFAEGWLLGEPDLVLKVLERFDLPADGRDVFRNFVIPLAVDSDKLVAAVEFRPDNRRIVHHALFFLDSSGVARKKDAADPGPGYGSFGGPGFIPSGALGGWAPGGTPRELPRGMGRLLRKGSDLVIQIHYHPSGKPDSDQSSIGIHYVKGPSQQVVAGLMVVDRRLDIPAGAENHPMARSYTLPSDVTLVGIAPHMHLLGRRMEVTATLPDGRVEPLIRIADWNFNWQDQYLFEQPLRLPKGTRLDVSAAYDNSEKNPLNPNIPPERVTWGEQTTDEMFICFFLVTTDRPKDLMPVVVDNLMTMGRGGLKRNRTN